MKRFTILVDMDDTLVKTLHTWIGWLNSVYDLDVKYEDVKEWDMQLSFPTLTLDQIRHPLTQESFWDMVEPKEGAVEYLRKLIYDGHKVYVCSASHPFTIREKIKSCLLKHFGYLTTEQLIFAYKKQMIVADFCIDDGIHNLVDASYRGILMSAPYNESIKETDYETDMVRVSSFEEAYEYVKKEAERCD